MNENLLRYLKTRNYWWDSGKILPEDAGVKRDYAEDVLDTFKLERITAITGIRRSGKTTIMFQVMDQLLRQGVDPRKIVFLKVDEILEDLENLRDLVSFYEEIHNIDPRTERVYFFIDEIQFKTKWQNELSFFVDAKYKSKFVISGSSKTLLFRDASKTLLGRIRFIEVFPLNFREFLRFNELELNIKEISIDKLSKRNVEREYHKILHKKEKIKFYYNQYLKVGSFPEWFKLKDIHEWRKVLLDDYFSIMLFKDIVQVFKPKDPVALEKLAREIARFSTQRFSYSKLSNRLDIDRETVKLYLYYLKSSMLIFIAEVYTRNKKERERSEKKIYFWEEGLRDALAQGMDVSHKTENVISSSLNQIGVSRKPFFSPFYWKNKFEVDFVFDDGKALIPIEVKHRNNPDKINGLLEFMEKFKVQRGLVITKDLLDEKTIKGKKILFIPDWLFLSICK